MTSRVNRIQVKKTVLKKFNITGKRLTFITEEIKHQALAKKEKINITENEVDQFQQNKLYQNNQKICFEKLDCVRDHTLSMQEGSRRVFVVVMKYFKHILMGNEIFLKTFDGPQKKF